MPLPEPWFAHSKMPAFLQTALVLSVATATSVTAMPGEGAAAGAGYGAAVGGTGGLLAGLGMLAIPGIGPVVAAGWLAATAAGAVAGAVAGGATGGTIGSLTNEGVDGEDAHVYAEGVRRGSTLVSARVDDSEAEVAHAIIKDHAPVDLDTRRASYREAGWERFDGSLPEYTEEDVLKERDRLRQTTQMMP